MELALLATSLISTVGPWLLEKAGGLADKAIEEGWEQRGTIWEKIKSLFTGDEGTAISKLEESPDSALNQKKAADELLAKLKESPAAAEDLEKMFKALPQQVKNNVQTITGNNNVAMQDVQGSQINFGGRWQDADKKDN